MPDDEDIRNLQASGMACEFLLQILLSRYLRADVPEIRAGIAQALKAQARNVDSFYGIALDDEDAYRIADIGARMNAAVDRIVDQAMRGATDPE